MPNLTPYEQFCQEIKGNIYLSDKFKSDLMVRASYLMSTAYDRGVKLGLTQANPVLGMVNCSGCGNRTRNNAQCEACARYGDKGF